MKLMTNVLNNQSATLNVLNQLHIVYNPDIRYFNLSENVDLQFTQELLISKIRKLYQKSSCFC